MNSTICYKCKYKCHCCQYGDPYPMTIKCINCDVEHPMFKLHSNLTDYPYKKALLIEEEINK